MGGIKIAFALIYKTQITEVTADQEVRQLFASCLVISFILDFVPLCIYNNSMFVSTWFIKVIYNLTFIT